MYQAQLTYTSSLVRRAAFAFVCRGLGKTVVLAFLAFMGLAAWPFVSGTSDWLGGVWCGAAAVLLAFVVAIYFLHYRAGIAKLRRMRSPHATIELTADEFRAIADTGSIAMPWTTFSGVWCFRDFWLLVIGTNQYITLPTADISEEIQAFIASRVVAAGGRVA